MNAEKRKSPYDSDEEVFQRPLKSANQGNNKDSSDRRPNEHKCLRCKAVFQKKFNLERHTKNCQFTKNIAKAWSCKESNCDLKFYRANDLKKHLCQAHGKKIEEINLTFKTHQEFLDWKREEEKKNSCFFPKQNVKGNNDNLYERYTCQMHGSEKKNQNSQAFGKRMNVMKSGQCLASIVLRSKMKNLFSVCYTSFHTH